MTRTKTPTATNTADRVEDAEQRVEDAEQRAADARDRLAELEESIRGGATVAPAELAEARTAIDVADLEVEAALRQHRLAQDEDLGARQEAARQAAGLTALVAQRKALQDRYAALVAEVAEFHEQLLAHSAARTSAVGVLGAVGLAVELADLESIQGREADIAQQIGADGVGRHQWRPGAGNLVRYHIRHALHGALSGEIQRAWDEKVRRIEDEGRAQREAKRAAAVAEREARHQELINGRPSGTQGRRGFGR